jgi:hypothetical protein
MFCQEQFNKIVHKIEQDHALLKDFPYWHQRVKLLTFNVNTRINYSLRTTAPFITEQATSQLDQSVDNFLADTLHFPANSRKVRRLFITNEPFNNCGWEFATAAAGAFATHHWLLLPHTAHLQSP